jgi:hypothetical protein
MRKTFAVALLSVGLILAGWFYFHSEPSSFGSNPGASRPASSAIGIWSAVPGVKTEPRAPNESSEAVRTALSVPFAQMQAWTPEAFMLLPEDQRQYTPTSRARAKWMNLHAFPTAESLSRNDELRLREEADHCNRLSANTLIERLRQRKSDEWRSLAESEASRGSLFAARAVLKDEISKSADLRDTNLIIRMTTIVLALGGSGIMSEIILTPGSRSLPDVDWSQAAGVMEGVFRDLDWWESRSRTKSAEQFARNPCTVVRAIEPPHPWTVGTADFYARHPEYN